MESMKKPIVTCTIGQCMEFSLEVCCSWLLYCLTLTLYEDGELMLKRRDDGRITCACLAEAHARFDFQQVKTMIHKIPHPPPNDPRYDDIAFQIL